MKTAEEILDIKGNEMITVNEDALICDALQLMTEKGIGAILIKKQDDIVGIWTERDLMKNCLYDKFDPKSSIISTHMTTGLQSAKSTDDLYKLLDMFLGKRIRHLLIKKDGKYIGILSSGDVIRAAMHVKDEELRRLNEIFNWEYYENWKWKKK